jgi:hypothetical protein
MFQQFYSFQRLPLSIVNGWTQKGSFYPRRRTINPSARILEVRKFYLRKGKCSMKTPPTFKFRMSPEEQQSLKYLSKRLDRSMAATIRFFIKKAARQYGISCEVESQENDFQSEDDYDWS